MKRLFLLTMAFAIVITGCKKDKQPGEETPVAVPVEEITLSAPEGVIYMGADVQLTATVLPEDASEKSLKWSSSDETIAEVNSSGLVSFFNQGSVTITSNKKVVSWEKTYSTSTLVAGDTFKVCVIYASDSNSYLPASDFTKFLEFEYAPDAYELKKTDGEYALFEKKADASDYSLSVKCGTITSELI